MSSINCEQKQNDVDDERLGHTNEASAPLLQEEKEDESN